MKIKTKLLLGFSSILSILIIISLTLLFILQEQNKSMNRVIEENYESLQLAEDIKSQVNTSARLVRDLLLQTEDKPDKNVVYMLEEQIRERKYIVEVLKERNFDRASDKDLIVEISYLNDSYTEIINRMISNLENGKRDEAINALYNSETRFEIIKHVDLLVDNEELNMQEALEKSNASYDSTYRFVLIAIGLSILTGIGIALLLINSIAKNINNVRNVITSVLYQRDDKLPRIENVSKDEIGDIAIAYNKMASSLDEYLYKELQYQEALELENWLKNAQAEIMVKVQGSKHIDSFGNLFITNTAFATNSKYGVLYIKNNDRLDKLCSYAGDMNDVGKNSFKLGEGLVGQCAIDNKIILMEKLPEDYLYTASGLGKAEPTSLLLVPIEFEDEVLAILELAKFEPFTDTEIELLNKLCNSIGVNINRVLDRMKIEELLSESQTQSEELQTQAEELQQQQEELRMINDELQAQISDSNIKTQQLEETQLDLRQKNRDIELSSKYKSEFLANMSHELRTPLNSMLILSQMLAENKPGNLNKKQIEYAETVYSSGNDLLNLINDILDLSKIESGKLDIYPEEIIVTDVIAFVKRQFEPIARQQNLDLEIIVDEDAPNIIFTDDQRLKQILKNLLSNAFKFTHYGGVRLFVQKAEDSDDAKISFTVKDTGIGISDDKINTIFEAFYQADGTTSRKYGGTGLGLSICKELSQLLQGSIKVESTEGEGSQFTLYLPDYKSDITTEINDLLLEEAAITSEVEASMLSGDTEVDNDIADELVNKTVLIVDDDMRNVFALTSVLESYNMNTIFAENGKDAIEILEKNPSIDIILMDIMMPVMNGYETMKTIRSLDKINDIPIIALTAKAMKNDREKCIEAGASDYISKPANVDQLVSLIKVWLYKK